MAYRIARDGIAPARDGVAIGVPFPRTQAKSRPLTSKKTSKTHTSVKGNISQPTPADLPEAQIPAIEPIRVEMLSTEMPVHQLAKRGEEEIRIIRRDPKRGQVALYWKVEPNPSVGRPGQLAYHLETWIIKRRLDELPRPFPRLIRVG